MRGYLKYFKTEIMYNLQYKTAAIAGMTTQAFWGLMYLFIYQAFYSSGIKDAPINYNELVSYFWLNQSFLMIIHLRIKDAEIISSIKSGGVAYELCRPYNLYFWWYVKIMAKKIVATLLRCFPIIILALLIPKPYNLSLPNSPLSFILFIISLNFGLLIACCIHNLILTISFHTYNDAGITSVITALAELISGSAIPVPLLPNILQKVTYYLPFRLIGDLPFRVYSGNIVINEAFFSIILQLIWVIILISLGNIIMKKTLKKVFIQGG